MIKNKFIKIFCVFSILIGSLFCSNYKAQAWTFLPALTNPAAYQTVALWATRGAAGLGALIGLDHLADAVNDAWNRWMDGSVKQFFLSGFQYAVNKLNDKSIAVSHNNPETFNDVYPWVDYAISTAAGATTQAKLTSGQLHEITRNGIKHYTAIPNAITSIYLDGSTGAIYSLDSSKYLWFVTDFTDPANPSYMVFDQMKLRYLASSGYVIYDLLRSNLVDNVGPVFSHNASYATNKGIPIVQENANRYYSTVEQIVSFGSIYGFQDGPINIGITTVEAWEQTKSYLLDKTRFDSFPSISADMPIYIPVPSGDVVTQYDDIPAGSLVVFNPALEAWLTEDGKSIPGHVTDVVNVHNPAFPRYKVDEVTQEVVYVDGIPIIYVTARDGTIIDIITGDTITGEGVREGEGEGVGEGTPPPPWNTPPETDWGTRMKNAVTTAFPFSLPWDFYNILNFLNTDPVTPHFKVDTKFGNIPIKFDVDLSFMDPYIKFFRGFIIIGFSIYLILITRKLLGGAA